MLVESCFQKPRRKRITVGGRQQGPQHAGRASKTDPCVI
jgi:hypothetical protein